MENRSLSEQHVHHAAWPEMKTMLHDAGFARLTQRKLNVLAPLLISVAER